MSEGEEYIEDFLNDLGIKNIPQYKITNLKGDSKSERIADFYLPKYKIYIEFFGMWNKIGEQKDNEYREKKVVYKANGIPCVYLYPENLGILPHILDKRIEKCLEDNKLKNELKKYHFFKFKNSVGANIIFGLLFLLWIVLALVFPDENTDNNFLYLIGIGVIYQSWKVYNIYYLIYIKRRYNLYRLLEN